jgi:serine/threonine protein kinase
LTSLSDGTLDHLREVADWPDLSETRYEIVEPIARGGMGTVYLANDRHLRRPVALKVLHALAPGPEAGERMLREARIIARLEHPGIVPVHDVGTLPDGRIFYAMKRVAGERLDRQVRAGLPLSERLRLFERICEAVAFAHAHGVVHRDLKPENVMVGAFGEVLVLDWGLAKLRSDSVSPPAGPTAAPDGAGLPGQTAHGTVLGTPGYMAPEQARGDVAGIDERTDVYALGAILYFLLVGRTPGRAPAPPSQGPTATWPEGRAAGTPLIERPRQADPALPRPLEAICLKALGAAPADRYPSVSELAADIGRFLAQGPVQAYREGWLERAGRVYRAHRTVALLVLAYLVMRTLLLLFARV